MKTHAQHRHTKTALQKWHQSQPRCQGKLKIANIEGLPLEHVTTHRRDKISLIETAKNTDGTDASNPDRRGSDKYHEAADLVNAAVEYFNEQKII